MHPCLGIFFFRFLFMKEEASLSWGVPSMWLAVLLETTGNPRAWRRHRQPSTPVQPASPTTASSSPVSLVSRHLGSDLSWSWSSSPTCCHFFLGSKAFGSELFQVITWVHALIGGAAGTSTWRNFAWRCASIFTISSWLERGFTQLL